MAPSLALSALWPSLLLRLGATFVDVQVRITKSKEEIVREQDGNTRPISALQEHNRRKLKTT